MRIEKQLIVDEYKILITIESKSVHGHSAMEMTRDGLEVELIRLVAQLRKGIERHKLKYKG